MKTKTLFVVGLLALFSFNTKAQTDSTVVANEEAPNKAKGGMTKFLLAGKATVSWTNTMTTLSNGKTSKTNSFFPESFMLMPLVKINKKLFLDAQVEIDANRTAGGATIRLNEMIIFYRAAENVSVFAGNFSPKYGLYSGIMDDFTNRYATSPIGMARGPQTQTGIGIQGGLQAGFSKFNYQLYLTNGPQHILDTTTIGNQNLTGQLTYANYTDNNKNKSIGGSIGFLPFSNSSLQLDVSGQYTGKSGDDGTPFQNISSTSWAVDLNYFHVFDPIMVRVLAEYNNTSTQNQSYPYVIADTSKAPKSLVVPGFNNTLSGWFTGVTLRPSGLKNKFLSNLELAGRIGAYSPPKYNVASGNAPWGENTEKQTTICLTYWMTWKTPINVAYDVLNQTGGPSIKTIYTRIIFFF
jgi:hypothetical protein